MAVRRNRKRQQWIRRRKRQVLLGLAAYLICDMMDDEVEAVKRRFWEHNIMKRRKRFGEFHHLFEDLRQDDERFFKYFRMSVHQFDILLGMVGPKLEKNSIRPSLSPAERLVITLRYFASGTDQKTLSENFRVGHSTVCMLVREVADVIWETLNEEYVPFPQSPEDWQKIARDFWEKWDIPLCLGAIDGKHVNIKAPPNSGSVYFNYKKFFSIVLMAVSDANNMITYFEVGSVGRASDGGVFGESEFGQMIVDDQLNLPAATTLPDSDKIAKYYFVTDDAFPQKENLMKPIAGSTHGLLPLPDRVYNYRLCSEFGPSELPPYADLVNFLPFSETVHLAENQEESLACEKTSDNILDSRETGVPSVSEVETEKAGENGGNSGCEETEDEKAAEAGETFEGDRAAGEILEEEETPEGFLYRCFLVALKTRLQKEQLPILVNNFFYQCLLPVVSEGRRIEMKETRYKKVGIFLEEMAKMGLIELEEKKKGVLTISGVNWASEELKSLEISDEFLPKIEDTSQQNSAAYVAPVIEEFYAITAAVLPLFQKQNANLAKGDLLKATEIRQIVTDYVKSDEFLQRENRVMLDDFLFGMLGGKERLISWNALFDRVYKVMTKSYRLTWPDGKSGRSLVRKTPLPLVELEVVQRAANKRVTLVNSLSTYGIKAEEFAKKIQTGLSCGATVSKDVPKSEGPQVQVQGNQVAYIGKILLEEYKLPRKYVKGLDLAVKKKKK